MRKERTTVLSSSCPQDLLFWKNFVYPLCKSGKDELLRLLVDACRG